MHASDRPWRDFADFLAGYFPGKMQKLAVNASLGCPNRDGTVGRGGCIYCLNASFTPAYCRAGAGIRAQLEAGKRFFARKYPHMRYLAYFQAYTSTHGMVDKVLPMYEEALGTEGVDGLIIGTRPDCMPPQLLDGLARMGRGRFVMVEYGAESSHDATLKLINRCHTWEQTVDAVRRTAAAGLPVGLHLINGLPGEDDAMILQTVDAVSALPVNTVKFHQLQVLRGTPLARMVERGELAVRGWTVEEYADLCAHILGRLRPDIAVERFVSQAPPDMLLSPRWGIKNHEFSDMLRRRLAGCRKPTCRGPRT